MEKSLLKKMAETENNARSYRQNDQQRRIGSSEENVRQGLTGYRPGYLSVTVCRYNLVRLIIEATSVEKVDIINYVCQILIV